MIKIGKNKKNIKNNNSENHRNFNIIFLGIIVTLCFSIVAARIIYIDVVHGADYSERAYKQQVKNQIISPNRGTIYDTHGEILAQSISVDTISLNPGKVRYSNNKIVPNEVIADGLSKIFDITNEKIIEKLNSKKSVVIIKKKVETSKIDELKNWMKENSITAGINIDADSKRSYPYNNLASNLIGFCSVDNVGQFGIEERWNDILTGTVGKVVTATDINGKAISDKDEQYIASENGSNIYLTIDTTVQAIVEKYLEQAVNENATAKYGTSIMMNPQNGEILAMATYPNYNLNEPYSFIPTGLSEEQWNSLDASSRTNTLLNLWKNKVVSDPYEPGSTFKLITASIGLEEGVVKTDTPGDFYCGGVYKVADQDISCWRRSNPHGSQTLRQALCNSCNPAFMQLGQRIGAKTLYKYFEAYGFFENIGNDISKSYSGTFHELDKIADVELATTSFGQRFTISPLQLITAISAICNDGVLLKPKIVNKIENTDTGSVEVVETQRIRQVISKTTADQIKNMMQSVVTDGTGKHAAVSGYSIGGKSGTSEPPVGRESDGYVASFVAISPIENTQVVLLVAVYGLQEYQNHQGGQTAGPVASQILSEVLPYMGVTSNKTQIQNDDSGTLISLPDVKDKTVSEAKKILQQIGFSVNVNITGDENSELVVEQVPKSGIALNEGAIICLYTAENNERITVQVPNVKEMTSVQATNVLKSKNLNINIDGTKGIVISQDPSFETEVEEGTVVNVVVKEELKDAQ